MDPRNKLYKQLDNLTVDPDSKMSGTTDAEATQAGTSSGVTPDAIKAKLEEKLGATHVEIEDLSGGCGQMYEAIIVSPQFAKKTTLARHRLVNSSLKDEIAAIHAWTPKCHTPEEWEKKKPQ
ncbi:bola-like protein [Periconia macrospinosa]|uniref:Bola-like protein n=1 Tax=Periconia macrospinosa TaxID=97972 RepID=A0A2V1DRP4_9PLEO|nr:bola-like protein [Periconia macrospinosa]